MLLRLLQSHRLALIACEKYLEVVEFLRGPRPKALLELENADVLVQPSFELGIRLAKVDDKRDFGNIKGSWSSLAESHGVLNSAPSK